LLAGNDWGSLVYATGDVQHAVAADVGNIIDTSAGIIAFHIKKRTASMSDALVSMPFFHAQSLS
jgi:hypothetical protein